MSKEEVLKEEQTKVARKYGLGNSLVIGHKPAYFNEAALSAMDTYAAPLLAEKEREIANKDSLINALERDVFHYSGNLQNTEEEIVKLKALIHEAYNQTYPNEQSWSDFKEKHNL